MYIFFSTNLFIFLGRFQIQPLSDSIFQTSTRAGLHTLQVPPWLSIFMSFYCAWICDWMRIFGPSLIKANEQLNSIKLNVYFGQIMGGAAGTAGTAAAVPLLREVRQDKVLPYHILVKKSQIYRWFSLVNLTKFGPYVMAKRFFFIDQFQHVHDLHDLVRSGSYFLESATAKFMCYVLKFFTMPTAGVKCNFRIVGTIKITGPL